MDRQMQDREGAERVSALMLDDVQSKKLDGYIEAACLLRDEMQVTNPWANAEAALRRSDELDSYLEAIARLMGITFHEAQAMIEGRNTQAAELAALRIGRKALDTLGYPNPEPNPEPKKEAGQMGQTLADQLLAKYKELLSEHDLKTDAHRSAAKVETEAQKQADDCRRLLQSVRCLLDELGMQEAVDRIMQEQAKTREGKAVV